MKFRAPQPDTRVRLRRVLNRTDETPQPDNYDISTGHQCPPISQGSLIDLSGGGSPAAITSRSVIAGRQASSFVTLGDAREGQMMMRNSNHDTTKEFVPESIPAEYEPQPWLKPYAKRELQWLCQQLHDRNTALQVDNRAMRQRLALYQERERQK